MNFKELERYAPQDIADDTSITVVEALQPELNQPSHTAVSESAAAPGNGLQEYQFISKEIAAFRKTTPAGQCIAITLPNYPFFTETRLISISVHKSGLVSVIGAARGGKRVTMMEQLDKFSFALSNTSFTGKHDAATNEIAVKYVT